VWEEDEKKLGRKGVSWKKKDLWEGDPTKGGEIRKHVKPTEKGGGALKGSSYECYRKGRKKWELQWSKIGDNEGGGTLEGDREKSYEKTMKRQIGIKK